MCRVAPTAWCSFFEGLVEVLLAGRLISFFCCMRSVWLTGGQPSWLGVRAHWPVPYGGLYPHALSRIHTAASGHQSLTPFNPFYTVKQGKWTPVYVCEPENNLKFNRLRVRFSSYLTFVEISYLISTVLLLYISGVCTSMEVYLSYTNGILNWYLIVYLGMWFFF